MLNNSVDIDIYKSVKSLFGDNFVRKCQIYYKPNPALHTCKGEG